MRIPAAAFFVALSFPAMAEPPAVSACRAEYQHDPAAHITCLERALGSQVAAPAAASQPPAELLPASRVGEADPMPAATPSTQPSGLGAEQVQRARTPADPVAVTIISATYSRQGLGTFRMSDGQVWRETMPSPAHRRLKDGQQYTGRLEEGRFGGYRLYVDGIRHMKTVERLE